MREYWINVYENSLDEDDRLYINIDDRSSNYFMNENNLVYRIHVKIHSVRRVSKRWPNGYPRKWVDGMIIPIPKYPQMVGRAKRIDEGFASKSDWMG